MTKFLRLLIIAMLTLPSSADAAQSVVVLPIMGAIGPASADFISRGLLRAQQQQAQLVILQIDTPGGLDTSMRQIIKAILASPVPVATFVAPSGARAASAGTYILYASHIAAMAPGTNVGAATPVQLGGPSPSAPFGLPQPDETGKEKEKKGPNNKKAKNESAESPRSDMTRKQVQDAAAYIRSLAQLRGRNAEWAERAVHESVSLSSTDALALRVIDVVARDVPELLMKVNGRKLTTSSGEQRLDTAQATVVTVEPDWKDRVLGVITDPNVALILMMLGVYGLIFEFANPGYVLPGVVGAIALLLGLFALSLLPVNYAGLALLLLGLAFMIAEVFLATFGVLGVGGVIAFVIGALMLIDTDVPGFELARPLIVVLAATSALFFFFLVGAAVKARRRPVVTGGEQLIGSIGEMLEDADTEGWARIHGEQWRVQISSPVKRGEQVRVEARNGLLLMVAPIHRL